MADPIPHNLETTTIDLLVGSDYFWDVVGKPLRLQDTHELILWLLTYIVLKSSLLVLCIKWSHHRLQSTV